MDQPTEVVSAIRLSGIPVANARETQVADENRPLHSLRGFERNRDFSVRREKALIHSGKKARPGTGSLHPVAIGAAVEVTKPPRPPV